MHSASTATSTATAIELNFLKYLFILLICSIFVFYKFSLNSMTLNFPHKAKFILIKNCMHLNFTRFYLLVGALVSLLSFNAAADSSFVVNDIEYWIVSQEDHTVLVRRIHGTQEDVIIPEKVKYGIIPYSVVEIDGYTEGNSYMRSVYIPKTITTIGLRYLFNDASNLQSITVSEENPNFTSIDGVLYNKEVTSLLRCPQAYNKPMVIPETVTSLEECSFNKVQLPEKLEIPDHITSIGISAFSKSDCLPSNLKIPNSVSFVGGGAFLGTNIESVELSSNMTEIQSSTFGLCSDLSSVTITENIKCIEDEAFSYNSSLQSIKIPNHTKVAPTTFFMCENLTDFIIDEGNENYYSENGMLLSKDKTILYSYPSAKGEVKIPDTVKEIAEKLCKWNDYIFSLRIPASVRKIGKAAFHGTSLVGTFIYSTTPPEIANDTFCYYIEESNHGVTIVTTFLGDNHIYVPKEALWRYQHEMPWFHFKDRISTFDAANGIDEIMEPVSDPELYDVYTLTGISVLKTRDLEAVKALPSGLYIVNGKKMKL